MLMDMLGIFIGFSSIMLMFSLLVTALVHGAQAALNLRLKNLKNVIEAFFNQVEFITDECVKGLLNKIDDRGPNHLYATALPFNLAGNKLMLTNIGRQELVDIINSAHELSIEQREQLVQKASYYFETLEEIMSQRFKQWMHQISIAIALVICFSFQLNCFSVLDELNQDSYYRAHAGHVGNELLQQETSQWQSEQVQEKMHALDFKITPELWPEYYFTFNVSAFTNWLGIIFSTILISFGAPFWFNRLKDLISLRDKFSHKSS